MRFILLFLFVLVHCFGSCSLANTLKAKGQSETTFSDVFRMEAPHNQITKTGDKKILLETGNDNWLTNPGFEAPEDNDSIPGWFKHSGISWDPVADGADNNVLKLTVSAGTYADDDLIFQSGTITAKGDNTGRNLKGKLRIKSANAGYKLCAIVDSVTEHCTDIIADSIRYIDYSTAIFTGGSSATEYKLGIYHKAHTVASAQDIFVDDGELGPTEIAMGTIIEDPVAFTPTGNLTTNVTYTGTRARFGKYLEQETTLTFTGTNTQSFTTINLPPGLTIDTSSTGISITSLATDITIAGKFTGTNHFNLRALTNGTNNSFNVFFMNVDTTTSNAFNPDKYNGVNPASNLPEAIASGTKIYIKIRVPISGWTAGARVSDGYDGQEIIAKYTASSAAAIPNTATVFNFGTKIKDDLNLVTTGAGWKFTAPSNRYCEVTVRINYNGSASASRLDVTIRKNGVGQNTLFKTTSGVVVETAVFPFGLDVVKGDTIDVTIHETVDGGAFNTTQQIDIACGTGTAYITPEGRNVTSRANNTGLDSAYMTCNAGSTIHSNPGSWVASIGNIASGACTVTLTTGRFSAAPHCFTQYVDTSTGYLVQTKIHSATASSLVVLGAQQAGGTTSVPPGYSFYLFCKGAN